MQRRDSSACWHWRRLLLPRSQSECHAQYDKQPLIPTTRSVISFMQQSFARLLSGDPDPTLADLSAIIVREAVRHSDTPMREYGIALQIFKNPPTPQHQLAAISGLTAPRELNLLMQTANMCMTGEVPEQSMPQVFHVRAQSLAPTT